MRGPFYFVAVIALSAAAILTLAAAAFVTSQALEPALPVDLRLADWIHRGATWTVGAALFVLAATRVAHRPMDAWVAAILAAIVSTVASFNPGIPGPLALAATIASALAPWCAIAFPPSAPRLVFVAANLTLVAAAPIIADVMNLPSWLERFAPIDPLTIPSWLHGLPLQWPWIVAAAPVLFGVVPPSPVELRSIPAYPPLFAYGPAALIGLIVWYRGRRQPAPYAWRGPAGRASRRG